MNTYAQKLTEYSPYKPDPDSIYYVSFSQLKIAWRCADKKQKKVLEKRYPAWTSAVVNETDIKGTR